MAFLAECNFFFERISFRNSNGATVEVQKVQKVYIKKEMGLPGVSGIRRYEGVDLETCFRKCYDEIAAGVNFLEDRGLCVCLSEGLVNGNWKAIHPCGNYDHYTFVDQLSRGSVPSNLRFETIENPNGGTVFKVQKKPNVYIAREMGVPGTNSKILEYNGVKLPICLRKCHDGFAVAVNFLERTERCVCLHDGLVNGKWNAIENRDGSDHYTFIYPSNRRAFQCFPI